MLHHIHSPLAEFGGKERRENKIPYYRCLTPKVGDQDGREDRAKIREVILAMKGYQGVLGTFSFTPNGDGLHEVSVVQIEQGKPKLLKSVSVGAK